MATTPDPNPDSPPAGPSEAPDQLTPISEPGRESIEGVTPDKEDTAARAKPMSSDQILAFEQSLPDYLHEAGISDGVGGTAGDVKTQDDLAR